MIKLITWLANAMVVLAILAISFIIAGILALYALELLVKYFPAETKSEVQQYGN